MKTKTLYNFEKHESIWNLKIEATLNQLTEYTIYINGHKNGSGDFAYIWAAFEYLTINKQFYIHRTLYFSEKR